MTPKGNFQFVLTHLLDKKGNATKVGAGSGHIVQIPYEVIGVPLDEPTLRFALLTRNF
jgi:hypothetical protein